VTHGKLGFSTETDVINLITEFHAGDVVSTLQHRNTQHFLEHYHVQKSLYLIALQIKTIHALPPNFFKIYLILSFYLCLLFVPKRDEMTEGWRELNIKALHNFHSSPNITTVIMSRRMRWIGNVARTGRRGMHIGFWWISQKERDN
jgi:hypothetical protein